MMETNKKTKFYSVKTKLFLLKQDSCLWQYNHTTAPLYYNQKLKVFKKWKTILLFQLKLCV